MDKNWFLNGNWKMLLFFFVWWFGILALTGTFFSGYHFMDDHGILHESLDVSRTTVLREAKIFTKNLLASKIRFRPFYNLHRRSMAAVFGTDFIAMSIYIGFLAVFTSFFLFLFMRKMGFSMLESMLFVFLTLLGEQSSIWWRLGNNETVGIFMLSVALLFMVKSVLSAHSTSPSRRWKKPLYEILFILFAVLASWCKESFILMIPALVAWKIWLTYRERDEVGNDRAKITLFGAIKRNLVGGIVLLLVCLLELVHVVKNVGTTGVGYAGYEGFQLSKFIKTAIQSFMAVHGWVILVQLAAIGMMVYLRLKKDKAPVIGLAPVTLLWPIILAGLIAAPQVVLYMKSGIMERYLLPCVMGYAFLMIVLLRIIRLNSPSHSGRKWKRPELIVILPLVVISLQQLRVTRYTAIGFAQEGKHINAWLQSIQQNTLPREPIMVITHIHKHFEASYSLKMYLDVKSNRRNTVFSPASLEIRPKKRGFWHDLNSYFFSQFPSFSLENMEDRNRIQTILIFPRLEEKFLNSSAPWFNSEQFERYTNSGGFVSYYKKLTTKETKIQKGCGQTRTEAWTRFIASVNSSAPFQ